MKKLYAIIGTSALAFIVLTAFTGCNGKTVKKTFKLTAEVNFNVDASSSTTYNQTEVLDASAQLSDFNKHKKDAISVSLDSVRYYTTLVDPNDATKQINNASIKIGSVGGSNEITLGEIQNVNLMAAFENANSQKLTINNGGIQKFADMLMQAPNTAQIRLQGDVNGPIKFNMRAKFYFTFVAWVL